MNQSIDENEIVKLFIDAQDLSYYQAITDSIRKTFSQVIEQAEAIERGVKKEKVANMATSCIWNH